MRISPILYILYILLLLWNGCGTNTHKPQHTELIIEPALRQFQWLIGKWSEISPDGVFCEIWSEGTPNTLYGMGYFIRESDTIFREEIQITCQEQNLYYLAKAEGQNKNETVSFKLIETTDSSWTFANPSHDFPQQITYMQLGNDSLIAEITGSNNGNPQQRVFRMKRMVPPLND